MVIDNKYYTPDISEFHVGFECESSYVLFNDKYKAYFTKNDDNKFVPVVFTEDNIDWALDAYIHDAYPNEFRVKYLDREDIESLGFKHRNTDFENVDIYLMENKNITLSDIKECHRIHLYNGPYEFNGIIKNKSELKVLLKQLGIDG